METGTPTGETPAPQAPSNAPGNTTAPVTDNSSAVVEAAKKEAEQAKIRANQLENEKKALEAKLAEQERKKLEENEEFKTLYEQTNADLSRIKSELQEKERQVELKGATEKVFADYPSNVVALAKTAGLSLSDDTDDAVASLKSKLDTFKSTVGGTSTPGANNPRETTPATATREEQMARIRGGDKSSLNAYIRELPGIKRMKEIAQNGA